MKYTVLIFFISAVLVSISCKKEIDVTIPASERKLVLNAVLQLDENIAAQAFLSSHVQDNNPAYKVLEGAQIKCYENENYIGDLLLNSEANIFQIDHQVRAGMNYKFEMEYQDFTKVFGETEVIDTVSIVSFDSVRVGKDQFGWETLHAEVKFNDPANIKNYYCLRVVQFIDNPDEYDDYTYSLYVMTNDPVVDHASYNELYFTDDYFDGKSYAVNVQLDPYELGYYLSDGVFVEDEYSEFSETEIYTYVILESMSESMYNYSKSVTIYKESDDFGPFSQPVAIYNNIENGLGIVGSKNQTQYLFNK